ncbi:MAG: hypothetical protein A3E87_01310 [Gammaproteobacteria bacterium RIFCSPHIGHO2_12_FULL_35_23]|nr:MAG: hypothetical protein A3E87_01310 [Gammaproteobacteria bacterium RIFCSPHIGHO2_12_FULL_35_23]
MWNKEFKKVVYFIKLLVDRFIEDRFTYSASALTYTTLLSVVPLMAIGLGILSVFPIFHSFKDQLQDLIFSNFVPASGNVIKQYFNSFAAQATKLSIMGAVFLVITAILMMFTIERALNDIWKVRERRHGVSAWLRYWAILSLAPVFAALSITATTYVISLPIIHGAVEKSIGIDHILINILPIAMGIIGLTLLYVVIPNCRVSWRAGFIGALVATVLFELAKRAFIVYVSGFNMYEFVYGAFAAVPMFLIWIYLSWVIILFGALISNILAVGYFVRAGGKIDGFMHAFLWLGSLWYAQQQGQSLSITQLYKMNPGHYEINSQQQLKVLEKNKLINLTQTGDYVLARDLSGLTLADLYYMLPWRFTDLQTATVKNSKLELLIKKVHADISKQLAIPLNELYQDFFASK